MNTQEVANHCIALFRKGDFQAAHDQFYADDIVSIEPTGARLEIVQGRDAIAKKGQEWQAMLEKVHSSEVSDPLVAENFFSCTMKMVVDIKGGPKELNMDEVCVFEVKEGKVVKEQFFYTPVPQPA